MASFTNADLPIGKITTIKESTTDILLVDHLTKLCIMVAVSEFEKSIKDFIKKLYATPKSTIQDAVDRLDIRNRDDDRVDYLYSFLRCGRNSFTPDAKIFFAIMGKNFKNKTVNSFSSCVKKQISIYTKEQKKYPPTSRKYLELADDIRNAGLLNYPDVEKEFLELHLTTAYLYPKTQ